MFRKIAVALSTVLVTASLVSAAGNALPYLVAATTPQEFVVVVEKAQQQLGIKIVSSDIQVGSKAAYRPGETLLQSTVTVQNVSATNTSYDISIGVAELTRPAQDSGVWSSGILDVAVSRDNKRFPLAPGETGTILIVVRVSPNASVGGTIRGLQIRLYPNECKEGLANKITCGELG